MGDEQTEIETGTEKRRSKVDDRESRIDEGRVENRDSDRDKEILDFRLRILD